jgi:hypothetical protein
MDSNASLDQHLQNPNFQHITEHMLYTPPSPPSHFVGVNVIAQNQLSFRGGKLKFFSQKVKLKMQ